MRGMAGSAHLRICRDTEERVPAAARRVLRFGHSPAWGKDSDPKVRVGWLPELLLEEKTDKSVSPQSCQSFTRR